MTVKMMKVAAVVSAAVCLGTASAQQTISVNFGQQGTSEAPQAGGDTVKVQGRGVGVDKTAALKDAYRDAIERAVGLYVDAETVANNDRVVTDQVLTHSNAYITDYRELGETRLDGGLVQLRIIATVKKQALTTKLTDVMPARTVRIDAYAQLVTKEKRAEDAAALLKNALDGLNPMQSLMVANIRPETQKIITADDFNNAMSGRNLRLKSNQVMLRYLFEVKLDREKYFKEFMPNLKKVLDQISVSKPKEIRLTELMMDPGNRTDFLKGKWVRGRKYSEMVVCDDACESYDSDNTPILYDPVHVYSILWQREKWLWSYESCFVTQGDLQLRFVRGDFDRGSTNTHKLQVTGGSFEYPDRITKVLFAMITSLNADCSNGKVTIYELEKSMVDILNEWHKRMIGSKRHSRSIKTNYNIVLLDKDGGEIGVYPWQIPNAVLTNIKFSSPGRFETNMVYATPFVGCFGENLLQWRYFILEKDKLSQIASIKIEPVE